MLVGRVVGAAFAGVHRSHFKGTGMQNVSFVLSVIAVVAIAVGLALYFTATPKCEAGLIPVPTLTASGWACVQGVQK